MAACISANKFRTEWVVGFGNDAQNFKSTMRSSGVPIVDGSSGIAFVVLSPPTFGSPDLAYQLTDAIALPRTPSTANAEGPFVAAWGATLAPTRSIKDLNQIAAVKNDSLSERDEVDLDESS